MCSVVHVVGDTRNNVNQIIQLHTNKVPNIIVFPGPDLYAAPQALILRSIFDLEKAKGFSLYTVSDVIDPNPMPKNVYRIGPCWIPSDFEEPATPEFAPLRAFLAAGEAPIAVGWGSVIAKGISPLEVITLVLRMLKSTQRRGVVLGGWARLA